MKSILRPRCLHIAVSVGALLTRTGGAPPAWWSDGDPPVITGGNQNNAGPANIGQAKWMIAEALRALDAAAPSAANQIRADLDGTPPDFPDRIVDRSVPDPKPAGWAGKQKAPLLIGQLKALAHPFYNHLNALDKDWVLGQIQENHNGAAALNTHYWQVFGNPDYTDEGFFPWNPSTPPQSNKAPATIGQLKAVFSLRFDGIDSDNDGLPDWWELKHFGTLDYNAEDDFDGDGWENSRELLEGTDPRLIDTDGDGVSDSEDGNPLVRDQSEPFIGETLRILTPSRP